MCIRDRCWPGGAGWNIRPFYEYAMLTGNEAFLKKHVFPLYRAVSYTHLSARHVKAPLLSESAANLRFLLV